ncbi:uncharacterized protein BP5553_07868 [Venustampulla echinocandica]|uniref:Uncharacterized protein n=1 Tax=Venustampulla echinocandica TaxID=2656787 RepID=A0A370THS9_9HELO|nr:uncharacterized protein BP5553_07868 [Venustampulla echinocandica]RDL34740.1 hypothetical protein BP5553_07868 [Venustampulla echinocandica]
MGAIHGIGLAKAYGLHNRNCQKTLECLRDGSFLPITTARLDAALKCDYEYPFRGASIEDSTVQSPVVARPGVVMLVVMLDS